jgi:hypothetical protein
MIKYITLVVMVDKNCREEEEIKNSGIKMLKRRIMFIWLPSKKLFRASSLQNMTNEIT